MRFVQTVVLFVLVVVFANGGKVTWNGSGKPQIEASTRPIKGCQQGGLKELLDERNQTKDCGL